MRRINTDWKISSFTPYTCIHPRLHPCCSPFGIVKWIYLHSCSSIDGRNQWAWDCHRQGSHKLKWKHWTHCFLLPSWYQTRPLGNRGRCPWGRTCKTRRGECFEGRSSVSVTTGTHSRETIASSVKLKTGLFHHANSPCRHRLVPADSNRNSGPAAGWGWGERHDSQYGKFWWIDWVPQTYDTVIVWHILCTMIRNNLQIASQDYIVLPTEMLIFHPTEKRQSWRHKIMTEEIKKDLRMGAN